MSDLKISQLTGYTTTIDTDVIPIVDVTAVATKKITIGNLRTNLGPAKAAGTDIDTGTDDAKFVTAKAINDSHNVPDVAPGTSGNVMTSNGTDWTSSAASTVPVKATGAELDTGTDDAKFATAKAIVDSAIPTGWTPARVTWTFASASTFTISGVDLTSVYTPGTRLKFTQTTVKYAVVISSTFSTNTTVTIAVNTDYTIANAAISANFYSYQANPQGYPTWFNFTPTFTTGGTAFTNVPTTNLAKYSIIGKQATVNVKWTTNASSGGTAEIRIAIPLTPTITFITGWGSSISANKAFAVAVADTPRFIVTLYDGTTAIANNAQQGCGATFDIA